MTKIRLEYQERYLDNVDFKQYDTVPHYRIVFPDGHSSDWRHVAEQTYHEYQGKWYFANPINWPEPFKNRVFELKDTEAEVLNSHLIPNIE